MARGRGACLVRDNYVEVAIALVAALNPLRKRWPIAVRMVSTTNEIREIKSPYSTNVCPSSSNKKRLYILYLHGIEAGATLRSILGSPNFIGS